MFPVQLVVFDMAGTTVKDKEAVEDCFYQAAIRTGLPTTRSRINAFRGRSKRFVIETLWAEKMDRAHPDFTENVENTYQVFRELLENQYLTQPVLPTEGTLETFAWLRSKGVKIALTTGFYRKVTNIILNRLGWDQGLDEQYRAISTSMIDVSVTPDEAGEGRPNPAMILKAMEMLGVTDPKKVINIGDTTADLQAGKAANCLLSLAVTNGSMSRTVLSEQDNDGLLDSMSALPMFIEKALYQ